MLRLFDYAASANCLKVRMALAQLNLAYERVPVDIFDGDTLSDEFAEMNPARRTPVLQLAAGEFLPESNAILLHVAEGTPLLPEDSRQRAQCYRWLFFEQSFLEPTLGSARFRRLTGRAEAKPERFVQIMQSARESLVMLEVGLKGRSFLAGDYSVADIALFAYTHVAADAGFALEDYPAISAWLVRVAEQPAHVNDLLPYPPNARPGAGVGIYS
jgi:glutathione S-transferase